MSSAEKATLNIILSNIWGRDNHDQNMQQFSKSVFNVIMFILLEHLFQLIYYIRGISPQGHNLLVVNKVSHTDIQLPLFFFT